MTMLHAARCAGCVIALSVVVPALAERNSPREAAAQGRIDFKPSPTTIATPLLATDFVHAGTWICSALNVGDKPIKVTVRAFTEDAQEVDFGGTNLCELEPGKGCTRLWETGIADHYCTMTFFGQKDSLRAGLQLTDDDGFSLFADAR